MKLNIESHAESSKCPSKSTICFISLKRLIALIIALITCLCVIFLCKIYIKRMLIWLENQDPVIISITINFLFILVSLPISIGYIVLVVAEGYLFGFFRGLILTILGANFGLFVAHHILKLLRNHQTIYKYIESDTAQAIIRLIAGNLCFKIVFCSRLTPIPFGLQNTIFAVSNVNTRIYFLASLLGLIPAQIVGVYVGTTLRSMQDVLEQKPASSGTYLFILAQIIFVICLLVWFSAKARQELMKAISEGDASKGYNIV